LEEWEFGSFYNYFMKGFAERLKEEMLKGLPGTKAHWYMASYRILKNFPLTPESDSTVAAVLILLYPYEGSIYTIFIQRPDYNGVHGGQISFPGGKKETSDKNIIQTAIRETHEETGINRSEIKVIGTLTPLFIPVSNIEVNPVVGWTDKKPSFHPHPGEVDFIIEADIKRLLDPSIVKTKPFKIRGELIDIRYFDYSDNVIWGATAMILHELLIVIRRGILFPAQ
jgi:8-oxo-dGTP pyrophosphatase MutT (NUDIX family)